MSTKPVKYNTIRRKGKTLYMKICKGCGDEWYADLRQNRCSLCGSGLRRVLKGEDAYNAPDIQEGLNRANRALLRQLPGWARARILLHPATKGSSQGGYLQ